MACASLSPQIGSRIGSEHGAQRHLAPLSAQQNKPTATAYTDSARPASPRLLFALGRHIPIGLAPVAGRARLPNSAPHGSTSGFWHGRAIRSQNPMAGLRAEDVSQGYALTGKLRLTSAQ